MGTVLNITVSGMRNPKSVRPIANDFLVSTFTVDNFAIDKGQITQASGLEVTVASLYSVELIEPVATSTIVTGA